MEERAEQSQTRHVGHSETLWANVVLDIHHGGKANVVLDIHHGGKTQNYLHHCSMASQGQEQNYQGQTKQTTKPLLCGYHWRCKVDSCSSS